jgi:hypothetical protein
MPYSQFNTLGKALKTFGLSVQEGRFFPSVPPIAPSPMLQSFLEETLPAAASGSEKVRSEGLIYPTLVEARRVLRHQVSLFSGEDFTVDESQGLNGVVDFLISRSPIISTIQSPVAVIVEAKKGEITGGLGQCVAELVAAQLFNQQNQQPVTTLYGIVSNGTQWRFLRLEEQTVTLDLTDYPLPPVDQILGFLVWILQASESIAS